MNGQSAPNYVDLAAGIVAAYLGHNDVPLAAIPGLIHSVHAALRGTAAPSIPEMEAKPAVPVRRSVQPDYIVPGGRQTLQIAEAPSPHALLAIAG